jgi:hypothetical protein
MVLAVHFETLQATENEVWDAIARRAGEPWRSRQDRALGLGRPSLEDSCRAALELYAEAASIAGELLDDQQRSVVAQAVGLAREILGAAR